MRIIGGSAAGTLLKVPKGFDVRPTPDLVRQAVFNSLGARVQGVKVLDLFSGTGALGLECLSRGALHAACVEKSSKHAQYIRENLTLTRLAPATLDVRIQDTFTAVKQLAETAQTFGVILADPPWGEKNIARRSTSFAQQLLDDPDLPDLLAPGGLFILGHTRRDTLDIPPVWNETKLLKHGDGLMRFLTVNSVC